MGPAEPQSRARGSALLIEHVAALDPDHCRPSALQRLERLIGWQLARLLLDALGGRSRRFGGR